jgi:hypothetical protein
MRCLLKQLVAQSDRISPQLMAAYRTRNQLSEEPTFNDIEEPLLFLCSSRGGAFLIFNALDECSPETQESLLNLFETLHRRGARLFVSTRPEIAISDALDEKFWLRSLLTAELSQVSSYVENRLSANFMMRKRVEKQMGSAKFTKKVAQASAGMSAPHFSLPTTSRRSSLRFQVPLCPALLGRYLSMQNRRCYTPGTRISRPRDVCFQRCGTPQAPVLAHGRRCFVSAGA